MSFINGSSLLLCKTRNETQKVSFSRAITCFWGLTVKGFYEFQQNAMKLEMKGRFFISDRDVKNMDVNYDLSKEDEVTEP